MAQSTLAVLFEQGGYRVTRLGIEELFGEVKHIDEDEYLGLNLPLALRYLPDLLIADLGMKNAFMVEVKYRRQFAPIELHLDLAKQAKYWPRTHTVIMISEALPPRPHASFNQDFIRVIRPQDLNGLSSNWPGKSELWDSLPHLHQVFKELGAPDRAADIQKCADRLTQSIKDLSNFQPVDQF